MLFIFFTYITEDLGQVVNLLNKPNPSLSLKQIHSSTRGHWTPLLGLNKKSEKSDSSLIKDLCKCALSLQFAKLMLGLYK